MRNWIKRIVEAAKTARYYKESEARRREFLKAWRESWRGAGVAAPPREVSVLARFTREELDAMKSETGATADATAVACFARVNLTRAAKREP